jgi:hypothetical protein
MAVRVPLVVLSALVVGACSHSAETEGYCGRQPPTPSPGTTVVSTVEVRNGDVVSGFPEGVKHFYVMPHRTPKPVGNGVTRVEPYLPAYPTAGMRQASPPSPLLVGGITACG